MPFILIAAPSWDWVIGANVLLGINQGLTWSMTVNMKLDLVGPMHRGLALGLNEMSGDVGVAIGAFLTGVIAAAAGLRPEPFYLGIAFATMRLGHQRGAGARHRIIIRGARSPRRRARA